MASVRRGLERYEAGELGAGEVAKGLRKLADMLEKLDGKASVKAEDVRDVFAHWVREMGKNGGAKLTPERDKKIRGRLREGYTIAEIKAAITNVANSPFHRGENEDGRSYNDITLICRNGSKLEEYRDMGNAAPVPAQGQLDVDGAREPERRYKKLAW